LPENLRGSKPFDFPITNDKRSVYQCKLSWQPNKWYRSVAMNRLWCDWDCTHSDCENKNSEETIYFVSLITQICVRSVMTCCSQQ
jgi:hypothetical protein